MIEMGILNALAGECRFVIIGPIGQQRFSLAREKRSGSSIARLRFHKLCSSGSEQVLARTNSKSCFIHDLASPDGVPTHRKSVQLITFQVITV